MKKNFTWVACLVASALFAAGEDDMQKEAPALNWDAAPVDIVLQTYSEQTDKTILKDPEAPSPTITLKTREGQKLTKEEYLHAIEVVLEMNGIHLEPYGEKFIRALPRKDVRKKGIPLVSPDTKLGETEKVVSMWIPFKNIATDEAQKALEGFKSNSGILLVFERTNTILVTDTEQNINRMLEVARAIDVASPVMENVFVEQIKNANANDIKQALEAIVQESQKEQEKNGKGVNNAVNQQNASNLARPAGQGSRLLGNRPGQQNQQQAAQPEVNASLVTSVSDADRGMIRGKVLILADERSNKLIIVTQKANMDFFRKVIEQLDVETTPDTVVKVYRLKYAEAEEVSDMINDLIGNASGSKSSSKQNQNANAKSGSNANLTKNSGSNTTTQKTSVNQRTGEAKAGELTKDNTTVLADKRINGLVVMTNKELVPVIEQIIEAMDVKLSQVLIETAIIEVTLGDDLTTGVDWIKRGSRRNSDNSQTPHAGVWSEGDKGFALGGGGGDNASSLFTMVATNSLSYMPNPTGSGVSYFLKSDRLNLGAIIKASKTDSHSKYIASPVVMTLDNKEATINATRMRYLLKGFQSSGNSYSTIAVPDYEQKEVGIEIKVTPKINPNGTVMLSVEEKYSQISGSQTIKYATGNSNSSSTTLTSSSALQDVSVPLTVTREMSADVLLENMQTVVFGGLTETFEREEDTGIPILKDIPWIGKWLFGKVSKEESRNELLVFMTPYVLDDGDAAQAEALRRKQSLSDPRPWTNTGWSKSNLADPMNTKEKLRRQQEEWKKLDEEHDTELALEKAKNDRVLKLERRAIEDAQHRVEEAKRFADELNEIEEKKAEARAEAELRAREENPLLQKLYEESAAEPVEEVAE